MCSQRKQAQSQKGIDGFATVYSVIKQNVNLGETPLHPGLRALSQESKHLKSWLNAVNGEVLLLFLYSARAWLFVDCAEDAPQETGGTVADE